MGKYAWFSADVQACEPLCCTRWQIFVCIYVARLIHHAVWRVYWRRSRQETESRHCWTQQMGRSGLQYGNHGNQNLWCPRTPLRSLKMLYMCCLASQEADQCALRYIGKWYRYTNWKIRLCPLQLDHPGNRSRRKS